MLPDPEKPAQPAESHLQTLILQAAEGQRQYAPPGYYGNYQPYPYGYPPQQQVKSGGIPAFVWIAIGVGGVFIFNKVSVGLSQALHPFPCRLESRAVRTVTLLKLLHSSWLSNKQLTHSSLPLLMRP